MKKRIVALIVAAGSGSRMKGEIPKQYRKLAGKAVLRHTVEAFLSHPDIDAVQIVYSPEHQAYYAAEMEGLSLPEPVAGGKERQDSVRLGIEHIFNQNEADFILIHDAARCLIGHGTISRVIDKLKSGAKAVIPTMPVTDTIKVQEKERVSKTLPREILRSVQTPQGFKASVIHELHQKYAGSALTDDAALAESDGIDVICVQGAPHNIKLTTEDDWNIAEMLLAESYESRSGLGFDVHKLVPANDEGCIWLCGIAIPHTHRLDGHSDADVGLHALVDAILGTIGAGDIGQHFPPSDPKWKGANSAAFVRHALDLLQKAGGSLRHVDITLICESPKLSPHREAMRMRVAELTKLPSSAVSIKATTSEGLGFTGRGEGIAAQVIANVQIRNIS